jgi:hypothetical protein
MGTRDAAYGKNALENPYGVTSISLISIFRKNAFLASRSGSWDQEAAVRHNPSSGTWKGSCFGEAISILETTTKSMARENLFQPRKKVEFRMLSGEGVETDRKLSMSNKGEIV